MADDVADDVAISDWLQKYQSYQVISHLVLVFRKN